MKALFILPILALSLMACDTPTPQERLKTAQEHCDGEIVYHVRMNKVGSVWYTDFRCLPPGIDVRLEK